MHHQFPCCIWRCGHQAVKQKGRPENPSRPCPFSHTCKRLRGRYQRAHHQPFERMRVFMAVIVSVTARRLQQQKLPAVDEPPQSGKSPDIPTTMKRCHKREMILE